MINTLRRRRDLLAFIKWGLLAAAPSPSFALDTDTLELQDVDEILRPSPQLSPASYTAISYYFPSWHLVAGQKSEWDVLHAAKPVGPGDTNDHQPAWGDFDNADPRWAEREIHAATGAGIQVFFIDWYYRSGKTFLSEQLDQGFLKAENCRSIKFALMWANHGVQQLGGSPQYTDYDFDQQTDFILERYLLRPNYWCLSGRPVFGIFTIPPIIKAIGPLGLRRALDRMRDRVAKVGLDGLHVMACQEHVPNMRELGIDSATNYQTFDSSRAGPMTYRAAALKGIKVWKDKAAVVGVPYFPDCPVGWNNGPRLQRRLDTVFYVTDRTPKQYAVLLSAAKRYLGQHELSPKLIFLSSWNEWTEDHYLLPDHRFSTQYLSVVKAAFVS